jgi:C-terminal processing protease CtpA/Prc
VSGISDTDALIIDLRYNGGGRPETVAFILFYLLDGAPVRLNDFVDCNGGVKNSYSTMTKAELPEKAVRFGEAKPLFVLTSKETVLGGEEMVYDLQALKRVSFIIGEDETTAGAANPVMGPNFLCKEEFGSHWWAVGAPSLLQVNGVAGTNWEQ